MGEMAREAQQEHDPVTAPSHYRSHPSGIECIEIVEHFTFNIGNTVKYLWRSGLKDGNPSLQELQKAGWYLNREIDRLQSSTTEQSTK